MASTAPLPPSAASAPSVARPPAATSLFRDPSYRNYWVGNFFYFLVFGAQRFAFVLLVLELTDRAGLAGVVGFALGIPAFFITIPAGVWADRMDRRRMVIFANLGGAVSLSAVASLDWTGAINAWLALGCALAVGCAIACVQPPLTAIVQMIVPPERLMNGIVLRTTGQNLAQFGGNALAGISIALVGYDGAFAIMASLYLVAVVFMLGVRLERPAQPAVRPKMRDAAGEGLRFVFGNPALRGLVIASVAAGIFMLGPTFTLVPEIGRTKLGVGPGLNSMLLGVTSIGMLTMSIFLATRKDLTGKGNLFVKNMLVSGPVIAAIGLSPTYWLTMVFMAIWGLSGGIYVNMNQTLIQANTPNEMMGRVMSIYTLSIAGLLPLGALLGGAGAELIGADRYLALSGLVLFGCAVWQLFTQRELRALD